METVLWRGVWSWSFTPSQSLSSPVCLYPIVVVSGPPPLQEELPLNLGVENSKEGWKGTWRFKQTLRFYSTRTLKI